MKRQLLLFLLAGFFVQISAGQNPLVKQWDKRFGGSEDDNFRVMLQTKDGGYLLGGFTYSPVSGDKSVPIWGFPGNEDFWIVKIDSVGIKQWDKDYGGYKDEILTCMIQTSDAGYLIGGFANSGIGGDKSEPNRDTTDDNYDYWIIKIDSLGNKIWDKTLGGFQDDFLRAVQQTYDGGFILGGASESNVSGDKTQDVWGGLAQDDYWIVKTDSMGNKQWDKDFGGYDIDQLTSLIQATDGGFILGGYTGGGIGGTKTQPNWGGTDFWIIKTDSQGNQIWDKDFGGTDFDFLSSISQTLDGGLILGGGSTSGIGGNKTQASRGGCDYWIVKTDSLGSFQWDKRYGGTQSDALDHIELVGDGGYLISGNSMSNIGGDKTESNQGGYQTWFVKTDCNGNLVWDKTLHTIGWAKGGSAIQTKDNCFAIASSAEGGTTVDKSQPSRGLWDYWIIKYCDTTSVLSGTANFYSSDTVLCGKQFIDFYDLSTNSPTSWQWFFPGGVPSFSNQQNPTGIFYNNDGNYAVTLIACNGTCCEKISIPNFINEFPIPAIPLVAWVGDSLISSPAYAYQWYFNSAIIPGATSQVYVTQQPGNYYVIISDINGCEASSLVLYTGMDENMTNNGSIYVTPDPTGENFVVFGAPVNALIGIYDVAGRVIFKGKIKSQAEKIQMNIKDGIYFIEINDGEKIFRKKVRLNN